MVGFNMNSLEQGKLLASLAVFRELYDNKKNIFDIIQEFIKYIVVSNGLHTFSITSLAYQLHQKCGILLPDAIVEQTLNKMKPQICKSQKTTYVAQVSAIDSNIIFADKYVEIENKHKLIIDELIEFIEIERKNKISDKDYKEIVSATCQYFIDETNISNPFFKYISAFIIKNQQDIDFMRNLDAIKEGVVLYTGLLYNINANEIGFWNTELTIFLSTRILFNFMGFNGDVYQKRFDDFLALIEEINNKSVLKNNKKLIILKYFDETRREIDRYFNTAKAIISGNEIADPSKDAMVSITKFCKSAADIVEKHTIFFEKLKAKGIFEDTKIDYYTEQNHQYNIINEELENSFLAKIPQQSLRIPEFIKLINKINILRKGNNNVNFENIRYIYLSANNILMSIAMDNTIRQDRNIPHVTTIEFITNKFWFKLNKGFGKDYPKSFNLITTAQVILSSHLRNSVSGKFLQLKERVKKKDLQTEHAIAILANLKESMQKPEDINEPTVDITLKNIEDKTIDDYLQEKDLLSLRLADSEKENKKYAQIIEEQKTKNAEQNQQLQYYKNIEEQKKIRKQKLKNIIKKICKWIFFIMLILAIIYGIYLFYYKNNPLAGSLLASFALITTIYSAWCSAPKKSK